MPIPGVLPRPARARPPEDKTRLEALNRRLWAWVEGEYQRSATRRGPRAYGDRLPGLQDIPGRSVAPMQLVANPFPRLPEPAGRCEMLEDVLLSRPCTPSECVLTL
jgi:hypothetical protein